MHRRGNSRFIIFRTGVGIPRDLIVRETAQIVRTTVRTPVRLEREISLLGAAARAFDIHLPSVVPRHKSLSSAIVVQIDSERFFGHVVVVIVVVIRFVAREYCVYHT